MITLFSGTPGSGKSLHLARFVRDELAVRKNTVIANFPINMEQVSKNGKKRTGKFIYLENDKLTVPYLKQHAQENHKVGKEGQTLLVIDEAGVMFNARDYGSFDRMPWINFLMTHRHYGFNVILVSQVDRLIDRQIRAFIEYDVKHRKANNYKFIGLMLTLLHIPVFVAITYWYGIRERCSAEFFRYRRKDSRLYDTYMLFGGDQHGTRTGTADEAGDTGSAGGDPARPALLAGLVRGREYAYCLSAVLYKGEEEKKVRELKFEGHKEMAYEMGQVVGNMVKEYVTEDIDIITWVPVSWERLNERGYDQAALIAYEVSKVTGIDTANTIVKTVNIEPLSNELNKSQRAAKVAGVYESVVHLDGKTVLLIDDVFTSGATLNEAAYVLRVSGSNRVICATYARAAQKYIDRSIEEVRIKKGA